jgi:hypothetical protein
MVRQVAKTDEVGKERRAAAAKPGILGSTLAWAAGSVKENAALVMRPPMRYA